MSRLDIYRKQAKQLVRWHREGLVKTFRSGTLEARIRMACAAAALAGMLGCATARNYSDPSGPITVGSQPAGHRARDEVKVVTFNIKFGERVDRAADLLSRPGPLQGADILVLQEMDGTGTEALSGALGLSYVYVPSAIHPSTHRNFGVAILSRWPLEDPRKVPLPHQHRFRKLRRAAAAATVLTPLGPLRVYAVHFETTAGARGRSRRDQARTILSDAMNWPGPIVVAGDFNGRSPAEEIAKAGFLWLTRRVHESALFYDFDHILVRGFCAAGNPPAAKAPDETRVSDHRPVWSVLRSCDRPS
jgi:endonuclease/exonuclease/phosphatase family metal-dependent hydrolase